MRKKTVRLVAESKAKEKKKKPYRHQNGIKTHSLSYVVLVQKGHYMQMNMT